ncbi:hypothetical protein ANN_23160 [Periplaneta americana]|uniref:Uncharacterized protein n=1 Tax=Periplaneta americana TaxID=6978 RepID=A0ABQ8SKS3_PERAM|nr:hypothetical protein ANN_23160 [Periplaneta americana]
MLPFAPFGYDKRANLPSVERGRIHFLNENTGYMPTGARHVNTNRDFSPRTSHSTRILCSAQSSRGGTRRRPSGGVSCLFRPSMGQVVDEYAERDVVIVTFEHLIVIGMYIRPTATTEFAIETILHALERAGGRNLFYWAATSTVARTNQTGKP